MMAAKKTKRTGGHSTMVKVRALRAFWYPPTKEFWKRGELPLLAHPCDVIEVPRDFLKALGKDSYEEIKDVTKEHGKV